MKCRAARCTHCSTMHRADANIALVQHTISALHIKHATMCSPVLRLPAEVLHRQHLQLRLGW